MESQRYPAQPRVIRITHACYKRLLEQAAETDREFPWLRQHQYFIDIATVGVESVWLKLG